NITDVVPIRGYVGYDDTGVQTLGRDRLTAGVIYGNLFGGDGTVSYQYTAAAQFRHLDAHAASYSQPINRDFSFQAYGSWAGVDSDLGAPFNQSGESWQVGTALVHHLNKNQWIDENVALGFD